MRKRTIIPIEGLTKETQNLFDSLEEETDLGVVVIGAAFLDVCLGTLLSHFFLEGNISDALLVKGPLNEFVARAKVAYALGLISKIAFQDLVCIAEIRNTFAHHHLALSFDFTDIRDLCKKLQCGKDMTNALAFDQYLLLPRTQFTLSVVALASRLMVDCLGTKRRPVSTELFQSFSRERALATRSTRPGRRPKRS